MTDLRSIEYAIPDLDKVRLLGRCIYICSCHNISSDDPTSTESDLSNKSIILPIGP